MDINPAYNFVGHVLKEFYSKFENILTDSESVIKMLKNKILMLQEFVNDIPSVHLFMELMDLMLNKAVTKFQEDFCLQILGIVMGTNLVPKLANIYMALLEELYYMQK